MNPDKFWVVLVIILVSISIWFKLMNSYQALVIISLNQIFIKLSEINNKQKP